VCYCIGLNQTPTGENMAKTAYFKSISCGNVWETNFPEYHQNADSKRITKKEYEVLKHEQDRAELLKALKPGEVVYTQVTTVSRSGMSRSIEFYILDNNRIRNITGYVANLTGNKWGKNGVVFGGCGMDMAWHGVYLLGRALWPDGTTVAHGTRNGEPDFDGGYALKHEHL
jgi:hypothetical protein